VGHAKKNKQLNAADKTTRKGNILHASMQNSHYRQNTRES